MDKRKQSWSRRDLCVLARVETVTAMLLTVSICGCGDSSNLDSSDKIAKSARQGTNKTRAGDKDSFDLSSHDKLSPFAENVDESSGLKDDAMSPTDDDELKKMRAFSRDSFAKAQKKEDFFRPPMNDAEREAVKICSKALAILDARQEEKDRRARPDQKPQRSVDPAIERVKKEYANVQGSRAIQEALVVCQKATALAPKHPLAWNLLATCHYTTGDAAAGDAAVERACLLDPYYIVAWKNRGVIAAEHRNWKKAEESFLHCAELIPNNPKLAMTLGRVYIETQRGDEAVKWFEKALELDPKNADAWYQLGYTYHCMKQFKTAEQMYNKALSCDPTQEDALHFLLVAQRAQGKTADAEKTITRMTEVIPKHAMGWIELGHLRRSRGDISGMKQAFREVFKHDPKNPEGILAEGEYYARLSKFREAKEYFEQARKISPSWSRPWHLLGQIAMDSHQFKEAEKAYSVSAKLSPNSPVEWNSLGCAVASQGRISEAETFFEKAVQKDPYYAQGWSNLSIVARDQGNRKKAIELGLKALKVNPNRPASLTNLADLYFDEGRLEEANNLARKALTIDPEFAEGWLALGAVATKNKDATSAIKYFGKAAEIEPTNRIAWMNLAKVYKAMGDKKNEAQALKMAIKYKSVAQPGDLYSMAYTLESLGHKEEARAAFKEGLNMDPSEADVLMNVPDALEHNVPESKQNKSFK